ncbi:UNVERIFIED_ORG: outer membrane autotransporter protein [Comamonas terrigena]
MGTAYNSTLSASGGTGPYSFSLVAGTLPAGLTLASNGTLSGTPTAGGTFNLTVRATDSSTGTGAPFSTDRAYTLTVNAATITLIPGSLPAASVGTAYSSMVTASGGTAPYGYAVTSGALPAGLTLAPNGTLSGTPTAGGTFNFTITATDSSSGTPSTGSQAYTLSLGVPTLSLSPSSGASFNGNAGSSFSQSFSASGGLAPYHFAALTITAGSLPTGLSYNTATGTLSGTPTSAGIVSFQITATDSTTGTGPASQTGNYTLTIAAPTITVNPGTLPNATIGAGYSQTVSASGGTAPYGYTVSTGSLPTGLTLNSANGSISGTPTAQGSFSFTITATDTNTFTSARSYTVTVQVSAPTAPPVTVSTGPNQPVTIHATANATGGPFTAVNVSTTPTSGTVTVQGMDLVYTPAASTQGAINFAYTLSNAGGTSAPIAVTVQVVTRPDPTADATVQGITASQQQAAVRLAGTQLMNFTQRLEHLRNPHRSTFTNGLQLAMPRMVNTEMRRCQSATSLLEQQECISNQGRMGRGSLTPGWSRAAQLNAAAAAQGMNTERAFASSAQVFGQDALPTEVGGTTSANRPLSAAQQFMAKAYPEHAQMTALPAVDATIAEPGSATRPRLAYWTSGMVDWGFADATAGQDDGLRFTTSGVTMGMDYLLSKEWTVGMGIGFAYDRTKIGNEGSRNHSKGVSTALYGSWSPAPAYFVDGVVGYSRMSFDTRRWVADAGEFAQGERDGSQWFAALSAGYEWRTEQWMLSPYGRLQFARSSLDAYTETGAGWHALHFDKQSITNTSASLGLRGEVSHETRWGMLLPFGRLELQHDFNHQSDLRVGYADLAGSSQNYSISSTTLGRNRVQLGFGSRLQSRVGTFAAEMQFTSSSHSFQRGLRLMYTTRW